MRMSTSPDIREVRINISPDKIKVRINVYPDSESAQQNMTGPQQKGNETDLNI
jgi:hypothetical protein